MATSWTPFLLTFATLLLLPSYVHAFGAGNIASISAIEGHNFRHGDIEDMLKTIAFIKGHKWTSMMIKRVYFGNWLRDYSQAVDVGTLKGIQSDTIRILVWVLSFLSFGYATGEFEVTEERLGVYRPEEHIDNPKDYADNQDARVFNQRLRGPIRPIELQVDPESGMKNYIANEHGDWATSAAYVKYSFSRSIHFGRMYTSGSGSSSGDEKDLCEAMRCLGQGLHTLEDFGAHTNYTELALREIGFHNVFAHTGSATEMNLRGKRVFPLVTGTFGMVDFFHSVLGEATDHFTQSEVNEMDNALLSAEQSKLSAASSPLNALTGLLSKLPGTGNLAKEAQRLESVSNAQQYANMHTFNRGVDVMHNPDGTDRGADAIYGQDRAVNPQFNNFQGQTWNDGPALPQPQWGGQQFNQQQNQQSGQHQGQQFNTQHNQQFNTQGQHFDQHQGQQFNQPQGQQFNQPQGQQFNQPQGQQFDQPQGQQFNQPQGQQFNQPQGQQFNASQGQQFNASQGQQFNASQGQQFNQPQGQFSTQQTSTGSNPQFNTPPGQQGGPPGPGLPGMPNFNPKETVAKIYPILEFRDKVVRSISAIIEKIPGLEALVEKITETLTVFILSLLAPFVRPIINAVSKQLQSGSSSVIDASGKHQYEPWTDPNCTDPTHSLLSKDHFSNILNEPAGLVASCILKFVAPRVLFAWQHIDVPVEQVMTDVMHVFHHPAVRDNSIEVHRTMFDAVKHWVDSRPDLGNALHDLLSSEGVRAGRNHKQDSSHQNKPQTQQHGGQQQQQQQSHNSGHPSGFPQFPGSQYLSSFTGGSTSGNQQQSGSHHAPAPWEQLSHLPIPGISQLNAVNKYSHFMPGMSREVDMEGEIGNPDSHSPSTEHRSTVSPGPHSGLPPPSGYEQFGQRGGEGYDGGEHTHHYQGGAAGGRYGS